MEHTGLVIGYGSVGKRHARVLASRTPQLVIVEQNDATRALAAKGHTVRAMSRSIGSDQRIRELGAEPVRCIESDPGTADLLRRNVRESKLEVSVTAAKVEQVVLAAPDRAWDVVWLDPPYALADTALLRVVVALEAGWLARDGLIVVERASRSGAFPWPGYVHHTWERRYGETTLHFGSPEQP